MKNIKSCPFCGGTVFYTEVMNIRPTSDTSSIRPSILEIRNSPPEIRICCKNCYATMIQRFENPDIFHRIEQINATIDNLIDRWNNRVQDAETQLKAERLNRLDEWQKELDDREDSLNERENEIDEKIQRYESLQSGVSQDKLLKLNQIGRWEEEVNERANHNVEWEKGLDNREDELRHREDELKSKELHYIPLKNWNEQLNFREKYLARRDLEIGEKLQRYLEIRDEISNMVNQIDGQNEVINQINDMLENTDDENGDAPLALLNLTLSTIRNSKNGDKKE